MNGDKGGRFELPKLNKVHMQVLNLPLNGKIQKADFLY
jgi:hypothetical protein